MTREGILRKAIDTYGDQAQIDICMEECSELIKALIKYRRSYGAEKYAARDNVLEELVDVQIMLDQMRMIYGSTADQEAYKLERLEKRSEGAK